MEKEEVKKTTLAVSYAILEGRWNDLDSSLDEKFTYTGDGFVFTFYNHFHYGELFISGFEFPFF